MSALLPPKRGRGRPRGPRPERLAGGKLGARVTIDVDGETIRKRVKLETKEPLVADKKIEKLSAGVLSVERAGDPTTFAEQVLAVHAAREKREVYGTKIELGRINKHVLPFVGGLRSEPFGERALSSITADEVTELLEAQRDAGYSFDHVRHIRNYLNYVFDSRKLTVMATAPLPPFKAKVKKKRAVATDAELLTYLGYVHPIERFRVAVLMRQAMSCVSRCFGGQRTNDLHVYTWDMFEIADGQFPSGYVPRTKTQQPQEMAVPEGLRPVLALWWRHQGKPTSGPVFPLLRGEHVGEQRVIQDSHAAAMRQDLMRAFGIYVWDPKAGKRKSGAWRKSRELTERERVLFTERPFTLPVDFHSWRRAWSQALMRVGVNVQTSAAITGHAADLRGHVRYLATTAGEMSVPVGVVPDLSAKTIFGREPANITGVANLPLSDSSVDSATSECARKDSNLRPLASEAESRVRNAAIAFAGVSSRETPYDAETPSGTSRGQNSRPIIGAPLLLSSELLWELNTLAMRAKRTDLVAALTAQIDALDDGSNVASLDAARKRSSHFRQP